MKTTAAILLMLFALTACNSQEKEKPKAKEEVENEILPKEKWEVKKEYDEFGNLIKYDSLYVWKYSNVQGDSIEINLDSIMDNFRSHFQGTTPFKWDEYFSYFPKNDSLLNDDFFSKDYYLKNWERQEKELFEFIKQIDSSRNAYLKKYYPGLMESKEKN